MNEQLDSAIAEFVYAKDLSFDLIECPEFKRVVNLAKSAPPSYSVLTVKRVAGDLLDSTVARLKADEKPLRDACMSFGWTVVSDGWDDVERNHLINFLVATSKGAFFDGTVKLSGLSRRSRGRDSSGQPFH